MEMGKVRKVREIQQEIRQICEAVVTCIDNEYIDDANFGITFEEDLKRLENLRDELFVDHEI